MPESDKGDLFQRIDAPPIAESVTRQLEALILSGVLRPGDRLPSERELAKSLDVSRPTLRDALADMESRGLLHARQGEGTFVADIIGASLTEPMIGLFSKHPEAFFDYLEFRRETEGQAAYHAALRATAADRQILSALFEEMEAAHAEDDPAHEAEVDAEFHMAVVESAHNIVMIHVMRSIYDLMRRGVFRNRQFLYERHGVRDRLLEHHRAMYNAIMATDPEAARAAVTEHLDYVERAMRSAADYEWRQQISARRLERLQQRRGKAPAPAPVTREPAEEA